MDFRKKRLKLSQNKKKNTFLPDLDKTT